MKHYQNELKKLKTITSLFLVFSFHLSHAQVPNVEWISPSTNETDVAIDKTIEVRFDRSINVDNSEANIYFFDADNSFAIIHQFQMNDPEVSTAGLSLLINPNTFEDWPTATNVVMRIDSDAIIGWNGILSHPFQIENDERPSLSNTTPEFGAENVGRVSDLVMSFTENIIVDEASFIQIRYAISGATYESISFGDPRVSITNNQITITDISLDFDTDYRVEVGAYQAITDDSGYGFFQLHPDSPESWTFHTSAASPPQVVSLSPQDDASDIDNTGQTFTIIFDEALQNSGYFLIRNASGDSFEEFQTSDLTIDGNSISFSPQNNFELGESYYITFQNVSDFEGAIAQNMSNTFWNFTIVDATPPELVSLSPSSGDLNVDTQAKLVLTYDEPVYLNSNPETTPSIQIWRLNGLNFETYNLPSPNVTGFGTNSITINPTSSFEENTKYYVRVINAIVDDLGAKAPNIIDPAEWGFDTGSPPQLMSLTPANLAIDVPASTSLDLTFDEPVFIGTSPSPGITIKRTSDDELIEYINFNDASLVSGFGTNTVTIQPSSYLPGETEISITMSSNSIQDASGDNPGNIIGTDWTFTTEVLETIPPTITSFSPVNSATNVSRTNWVYTLTFSEPVKAGSGLIILKKTITTPFIAATVGTSRVSFSGNEVIIDFNADGGADGLMLEENTTYFLEMASGVITDLAGNDFSGLSDTDYTFTTEGPGDITPPVLVSLDPPNFAEEVAVDQWDYSITFDEPIQLTNSPGVGFQLRDNSDVLIAEVFSSGASISGNTLSVDFNYDGELDGSPLEHSTTYHIEIESGYVEDLAGNDYAGFSNNTTWQFETIEAPDNDPPIVISLTPSNGAVDIELDANLVIEFNEDIYLDNNAGTFELRRKSPDQLVEAFDIFGPRISGGNNSTTITIDPTNDLDYETEYYFLIGSNDVIIDGADNAFAGFSSDTDWSFSTGIEPDNTPPSITNFSPVNGASNVANDVPIILTFSEDVQLSGFGPIRIRRASNNANLHEIDPASGQVEISGNVVTIQPIGGFLPTEEEVEVYVNWSSTPFEDLAGNQFNGLFSSTDYRFTVNNINSDVTPPSITTLTPADNATNVAIDLQELTMTFDEDVQKFHLGNIIIRDESGSILHQYFPVSTDNDVSVSGNVVTIALNETLEFNTLYYVQLASNTFEDLAGNAGPVFVDSETWNFTTEAAPDNTPPAVQSLSPGDNTTDVAIDANLSITFDEPVFEGLGSGNNIIIREADATLFEHFQITDARVSGLGTNTLTFNPDNDFDHSTSYYITLPSQIVEDANENGIDGWLDDTTWNFTTEAEPDFTAPSVVSFSPAHQSTDVPIDIGQLQITFDEDIQKTSPGNIIVRDFDNNILVQYFPAFDDSDVTVSGNVLTMNLPEDLAYETGYYIQFISGTVADLAGNNFLGFNNASTWIFTAEAEPDFTPPTITNFNPANGETGVDNDAPIILTFSEDVQLTGYINDFIHFKRVADNQTIKQIDPESSEVTISGNVVTIQPSGGILSTEEEVEIYMNWSSTPFEDLAGNDFNDLFSSTDYRFTVDNTPDDVTPPFIVSFVPAHQSTDVSLTISELKINFDEDVQKVNPGNIIVRDFAGTIIHQYFPVFSDPDVVINGSEVTLNFPETLTPGTSYYVQLASTPFEDLSGNPGPNFLSASEWVFTAEKLDQSISFNPLDNVTFGDADFLLTGLASSGLTVNYASSNTSVATISGSTVTIVGAGTTTITASQAGNSAYKAAAAVQQTLIVEKADQIITIDPIADKITTDVPFGINASTTSGLALDYSILNGPASVSGSTITLDGSSGTVEVEVSQSGNTNYNPVSASVSFNVSDPAKTDQTITFASISDKVFDDDPFTLSATASSGLAVEFSIISGPVDMNNDELTITGVGLVTIAANQAGDATYNPAPEVTRSFYVSKADQTITFDEIIDKTFGDGAFELVADASSGLNIDFSIVSGPISRTGNTITIDGAGTAVVAANQTGNENYNPATEVLRTFEISKADQVIIIDLIEDKLVSDAPFEVNASVNTGLELTYAIDGPAIISGSTITLDGTSGTIIVTVSQAGNENYNASSESVSFEVNDKSDQTISFAEITDKVFGDPSFELTAMASSGLPIEFSILSGPVSISENVLTINGAGTATIAANQAGNDAFKAAPEVHRIFEITKANQVIIIESIDDKLTTDAPFEVSASVDTDLELTYELEGPASLSETTVTLGGTVGIVTITVSQNGNDNYHAVSEQVSFEVTQEAALSIEAEQVSFYPNPVADYLTIESLNPIQVHVISLKGERIKSAHGHNFRMDLSDLSRGIYILEVHSDGSISNQKILKIN